MLDATMEKSSCVETYIDVPTGILVRGDEDCLYVNVYSSKVSYIKCNQEHMFIY